MIDLDILAESRASKLGQDQTAWRKAVWTPEFQKLSQTLTDGEVETFFDSCRTVKHFEIMTGYLMSSDSGITFSQMMDKVARSGYQMDEWVDAIVEVKNWVEGRGRKMEFFEVLMVVGSCAAKSAPSASPLLAAVQDEIKKGTLDRN